jgi:DNA polymerase I-like protein with 3'-5' exonuclease and polymerase domains
LYLAYDLETSSLNPRTGSIIGIAIASATWQTYIVLKEWDGSTLVDVLDPALVLPLIKSLLNKRLLGHNFSFDARFTYHTFGVEIEKALHADSMLLAHTLDENRFDYKLKTLGKEIFGEQATDEQDALRESIKSNGGKETEYYKANTDVMAKYAMQDVRLTYDLWKYLDPLLNDEGLRNFYYKDEVIPLYKHVTIPMERTGIPVDVALLEETRGRIRTDIAAIEERIQASIAPLLDEFQDWYISKNYPFKLTGRFKQELAKRYAPPNWPKTKNGTYSFSKADIERAVKKELIQPNSQLQRWAQDESVAEKVPAHIIREIQLALLAEEGTKYTFNIASKDHLKRLFFTKLKEEALSYTDPSKKFPDGQPQVDDDFLDLMAKKYDWAEELRTYNRLCKISSSYIDRILDSHENGIFYPQFHQHRTVSGRYSGDTQQFPRFLEEGEDKEVVRQYSNLVRRFFVSNEDWSFADFDYDSQEVKVFAHVSGDQNIKDIFAAGDDFYSSVCINAERLEGFSANKKSPLYLGKLNKPARQKAKAYALGLAFNMSPYKLKFELNCSEAEAQAIYNNYFESYPQLKEWLEASKTFALKNGYIKTEAGRIRRYPSLRRHYAEYGHKLFDGLELWKEYKDVPKKYKHIKKIAGICKNFLNNSVNHQVQGLAASITNRAAIKTALQLKQAKLQAHICNVIHDQITVHCPDHELPQVMEILQFCMETAYPISVPLTAPPSHGKNFAESKG